MPREGGRHGLRNTHRPEDVGFEHSSGSFYKQFASKDALLSEALSFAVDQRRKVVAETTEQHGDTAAALLTSWYLSPEHRDDPTSGCAVAALVGEAATHADGPLRDGYRTALDDLLSAVAARHGDASGHVGDADLAKVALMVGALQLARATAGTPLSEQFLAAASRHLQTQVRPIDGGPGAA